MKQQNSTFFTSDRVSLMGTSDKKIARKWFEHLTGIRENMGIPHVMNEKLIASRTASDRHSSIDERAKCYNCVGADLENIAKRIVTAADAREIVGVLVRTFIGMICL